LPAVQHHQDLTRSSGGFANAVKAIKPGLDVGSARSMWLQSALGIRNSLRSIDHWAMQRRVPHPAVVQPSEGPLWNELTVWLINP
jgi:hypothetical protein